jgi:Zn-dependent peptidase ImmA (M78 family)
MKTNNNIEQCAISQLENLYNKIKHTLNDPTDFYPIDIKEIIRFNGWNVSEYDGLERFEDEQRACGRTNYEIKEVAVDLNLKEPIKRFTLAHELGHIVLHKQLNDYNKFRRSKLPTWTIEKTNISEISRKEEIEAQNFAAYLLMPSKAVRAHFYKLFNRNAIIIRQSSDISFKKDLQEICTYHNQDEKSLCDFFEVSIMAMSIRLKNLRLVICT